MVVKNLVRHTRVKQGKRREFERRYQAASGIKKAELVEGVVYVASPVRSKSHGQPHGRLITWMGVYEAVTPGVDLNDNATVRLDLNNEPQPDALLRIETGGQSRITGDDYIEGAPELIAEVAASSAAYDLHDKKQAYQRNGVQEYLVWQVFDQKLDWFRLQDGNYVSLQPDGNGVVRSKRVSRTVVSSTCLASRKYGNSYGSVTRGINFTRTWRVGEGIIRTLVKQSL